MPNWQPKWDDVMFDHEEASEAISLCRGALATLADRHAVLQGPYEMACVNWRGVKRYRFDAEWSAMHSHAEAVAEQLRAHIIRLSHESESALVEQRHRENERARWFREKAAEDAAREAARVAAAQAAALAAQQAAAQAAANAVAKAAAESAQNTAALNTATAVAKPALIYAPIISSSASGGSSSGSAVPTWTITTEPVTSAATPTAAPSTPTPSTPAPAVSPVITRASGQLSGR